MIAKLKDVLRVCCDEFDVSIDEAISSSRKTELVYCRTAFVLIAKKMFDLSNKTIGEAINKKHNSVHRMFKHQPNNKFFLMVFDRIKMKLNKFSV